MAKFDENFFKASNTEQTKLEDILSESESILWQGKPKKSAYILAKVFKMLPLALLWLLFDGFFIGMLLSSGATKNMPPFLIVFICVFFLFHLIPVWIWIAGIVTANRQHKNLEYAFTDKRIIIRSGIIGIDVNSIYYVDIVNVNSKVGLIDKLLKVGDIYLLSGNKAQVLWDIENPYHITTRLQKIVNDIKSDVYYPNALRPEVNEGYNTKYKDK